MKNSAWPVVALIAMVRASDAQPREAERKALEAKIEAVVRVRDAALAASPAAGAGAPREAEAARAWDAVETLEVLCHDHEALHRGTAARCTDRRAARDVARQLLHLLPAEERYSAECEWRAVDASKKQMEEAIRAGKAPTRDRNRKSELAWDRTCGQHAFANQRVFVDGVDRTDHAAKLRALFLSTHPSRFVFLNRNVNTDVRPLKRGEAVLVYDFVESGQHPWILTPDLVRVQVEASSLSAKPFARAPRFAVKATQLTVYKEGAYVGGPWDLIASQGQPDRSPPFLAAADPNSKAYLGFVQKSDRFWKCADAQWAKLDPDATAGNYDLVTFDATTGAPKRVEHLVTALERKVCSACNCAAIQRERVAAARAVLAPLQATAFSELEPIRVRLESLAP